MHSSRSNLVPLPAPSSNFHENGAACKGNLRFELLQSLAFGPSRGYPMQIPKCCRGFQPGDPFEDAGMFISVALLHRIGKTYVRRHRPRPTSANLAPIRGAERGESWAKQRTRPSLRDALSIAVTGGSGRRAPERRRGEEAPGVPRRHIVRGPNGWDSTPSRAL